MNSSNYKFNHLTPRSKVWAALGLDESVDVDEAVRVIGRIKGERDAISAVLDSVAAALLDPDHPEESPVDAARRLVAERDALEATVARVVTAHAREEAGT